jgi:methyltransferase (TIGR00027 family)
MQKDPKLRCPDHMAIRFVGGVLRFVLLPGIRNRFIQEFERRAKGVFFHHQARTKYIDEMLRRELAAGATQVVLLGAGFDSRAYRSVSEFRDAHVFEVDHPATSATKQRRVRRALGGTPAHVTYVPVHFTREQVEDRLCAANYQPSRVTFFIWEGVSCYLDAAAVDATFAMVARAPRGSSIVFDYVHRSALEHPDPDFKRQLETTARMGEPYQFAVNPAELGALLGRHGLSTEANLGAEELGARYLVGRDGKRWGDMTPCFSIAFARRT